jgi:hypothetical protein
MLVSIAFWEGIMSQQEVSSQPGVEVVYRSHVRVEAKPGGMHSGVRCTDRFIKPSTSPLNWTSGPLTPFSFSGFDFA